MSAKQAPSRLGLGLAALMGEPAVNGRALPTVVPVAALDRSPFQPRGALKADDLAELTASVRDKGILQPILVRPHPIESGRFQIVAGERRWRAAQAAGLHEIPALIRPLSDIDCMSAALVENLQRADLNAIEEAEGFRRLVDEFALTQDAVAQSVGKSRSHVANTLRLLNLPISVQTELRNGVLTAGHARALLAHPEPAKAALDVIARGLNVRQTEALASVPRHGSPFDADDKRQGVNPDMQALAHTLSERLGLRVEVVSDGRRGSLRIRFENLEQLDGIFILLNGP